MEHSELIDVRQQIGQRLKIARQKKGWTQKQFSAKIKIAQTTISSIEKGNWAFSIDVLLLFCYHLELNLIIEDAEKSK